RRDIGDVRLEIEEILKNIRPKRPPAPRKKRVKEAKPVEMALTGWENPYEFDTTASSRTFKGRQSELDEVVAAIGSGTHTAVFGRQRMGKTSLNEEGLKERLEQIPTAGKAVLLVKIDLQGLGGEQVKYRDLVHAIIEAITARLTSQGVGRAVQDLRGLTNELFA